MRTHDEYLNGKLVSQTPYTIIEEIKEDFEEEIRQVTKDMIGETSPANYDAFKASYDPIKMVDGILTRRGLDPKSYTDKEKELLAVFLDIAIKAIVFAHGKFPGVNL